MADTAFLENDVSDQEGDTEFADGPEQTQSWLLLAMGVGTVAAIVVALVFIL